MRSLPELNMIIFTYFKEQFNAKEIKLNKLICHLEKQDN